MWNGEQNTIKLVERKRKIQVAEQRKYGRKAYKAKKGSTVKKRGDKEKKEERDILDERGSVKV